MKTNKIYHLNDRTIKYSSVAESQRQHEYFELPGEFKTRLPQEIIFPNMATGRQDECYLNDEGLIIGLEEESEEVTPKTLEKFSKYVIFRNYWNYPHGMYLGVICHKDPKKDFDIYEYGPSTIIKVFYHYISQEELWDKYEKIINKVGQKEELTDTEALDIAFISKFISKKHAPEVIEKLSYAFKDAKIREKLLKIDVGVILGAMILKRIEDTNTQNKLLKVIGMQTFENELQRLVYDEFGDELDLKDQEIKEKNKELKAYKSKIEQLKQIGDLDSPKAKKIIESLMLL